MKIQIVKRNGQIVNFDMSKISNAIKKAFDAREKAYDDDIIEMLALKTTAKFEPKITNSKVSVEDIQDAVENVLIEAGYADVAKAYILYREQHTKNRDAANTLMDYKKVVDGYVKASDWRVKENSTVNYSLGGLILSNSGAITANYWLSEVYDKEIADAHRNADMHIHDLSMLSGYCFTGDTRVKSLDGTNPTFKELVENGVKELWVFAYDTDSMKVVPAKAVMPRITRSTDELIKVTLCSGKTILSTPDHLFMTRDGNYIEAKNLKTNMSLMPLYIGEKGEYVSINKAWTSQGSRMYLHRWIAEQTLGRPLDSTEVVHHINGKKHDNRPDNLEVIQDFVHRGKELVKTMQTDKWKVANNERVVAYNKSLEKRQSVSDFAKNRARTTGGRFVSDFTYNPEADAKKVFYNHQVRKVEKIHLDEPVEMYDLTVPKYENFALDAGVFVHNCAGWDLKQLVAEGLGGVPGKITSAPAAHLSTLCNQMVNFLGILQNEWAGAQAFSSFDTYLAPYVKADNLTYKQVKQCIQSFIFGVNTPSRWGCVDKDTELLTVEGFKKYSEVKKGEMIYTWNNGALELNPINEVIIKEHHGKMHSYKARGYHQFVSPDHRVLCKKFNTNEYTIKRSEEIIGVKTPYSFPVKFSSSALKGNGLSSDEVQIAAIIYCDGSIDMRNGKVHKITIYKSPYREGNELIEMLAQSLELKCTKKTVSGGFDSPVNKYSFYGDDARTLFNLVGGKDTIDDKFLCMDSYNSNLFLQTWALFDGRDEKLMLQYDNNTIKDQLQHIALRAGYTSYTECGKANYIKIRQVENLAPSSRTEEDYDGIIWCPNVENGTAVFRKDDCVFISGQCQAPFTNITLDWTVPNDLAELPAIVGGKEMDFKYKDCKAEMDMVNKAFIEIMIEGDSNGRGFQYPIPTYSITRDFDWSETENNKLLFEMTAKYGTPYFSNYINSDMEPSDVRSMCPLFSKEKVLVMDEYSGKFHISTVENLYGGNKKNKEYFIIHNGKIKKARLNRFDDLSFYEVELSNGHKIRISHNHTNLVLDGKNKTSLKSTDGLTTSDYLPFNLSPLSGTGLDYEDGIMVGAFAGDGSLKDDYSVTYCLNNSTKKSLMEEIIKIAKEKYGCKISISSSKETSVLVTCTSKMLRGLIEDYISGQALTKTINPSAINRSLNFRRGLIDGYMRTDGGNKNRIYTSSSSMVETFTAIAASVGIPCKISVDGRKEDVTYSDNPVYTIKMYITDRGIAQYGDVFKFKDNYMWFRVTNITKMDTKGTGYCFEVINDGEPYFMLPCGLVTHNCRLRLDLRELRKKSGGYFGAGSNTGSIGVVTLNMPRLGYLSESKEDFYNRLDKLMDIAARSLDTKRKVITQLLENGMYPYTKRYLGDFHNHFSTIGLVGMNEACLNAKWINKDLTTKEAQDFTKEVLNHMRERLSDYQEKYGDLFNLEATPAESTSFRLAKHDRERYPDIIAASDKGHTPYYTNSSHLPVGFTSDVFEALDIQDELQILYTSGTVFHAFLGERLPDWRAAANLVRKIAENYRLPYYTMSPTYSVCKNHGYIVGESYECPICGEKTEVYSRITGYYRPVQNWNDGKLEEFKERKEYDVSSFSIPKSSDSECEVCKIDVETPNTESEHNTEAKTEENDSRIILFASKTCPNCKAAAMLLDKAGVKYEKIYAEDDPRTVSEYGIRQAPTLVVEDNGKQSYFVNLSNIRKFLGA